MVNIDPLDEELLPVEQKALINLIGKHDQYIVQGRYLEARAMEKAVNIVFATLKYDHVETTTEMGKL